MTISGFLAAALAGVGAVAFLPAAPAATAPTEAADSATAYRAIRIARTALGPAALNRLVEVSGVEGAPQPYVWKIVLKDGDAGSKEVDVAGGKIVSQRTLTRPPASAAVIKLTALNLDSSGAFDAADAQARKVRVRFDSVNYTLHASQATGKPVWTMELFNQDGAGIGTMRLTATDGTIASIDGRLANGPGRPGEPLTAATSTASSRSVATTTTTIQTTTVPANPPPSEPPPPPVHDVDNPPPAEDSEGGFFTRAGRTLDHAHDNVAHTIDTAHDNVAHTIDAAHATVEHSLRATGAKLQRFFTGHSDLDQE